MKNVNTRLYKLFYKKPRKSWKFSYNTLIIRRVDYCIFKIIDKFKNKIKVVHFSKYLPKEFVYTVISYCLNLRGKTPIVFQTAGWVYIHLPEPAKEYIFLRYIRYDYLNRMVQEIKRLYTQGIDFVDIRKIIMIKYKVRKISLKTIIKVAYISYYSGVKMAVKWLKNFIRKINLDRIARIYTWTGKPPPLIIF